MTGRSHHTSGPASSAEAGHSSFGDLIEDNNHLRLRTTFRKLDTHNPQDSSIPPLTQLEERNTIHQPHQANILEVHRFPFAILHQPNKVDYFGQLDFGIFGNPFWNASLLQIHFSLIPLTWFWNTNIAKMATIAALLTIHVISTIPAYREICQMIVPDHTARLLGKFLIMAIRCELLLIGLLCCATPFEAYRVLGSLSLFFHFLVYLAYMIRIRHLIIFLNRPEFRDLLVRSLASTRSLFGPFFYRPRFNLIIAGSGGHSTEMLKMMALYKPYDNTSLRRWVTTAGDTHSAENIRKYEAHRSKTTRNKLSGAFDIVEVRRAIGVKESLKTIPRSFLRSCMDICNVLLMSFPWAGKLEFPNTIICNGPGTAAAFVFIAYVMKMVGIIPVNRAQTVYIESWARTDSLSRTGQFFYYLNIADVFIVQHPPLVEKYPGVHLEQNLSSRKHSAFRHTD
ncbi:oligosaccharide biosynthesis protein Alg14 like-domain-containing protein [Xylariales sp. PMI_506]|nr:oligosaccharide biosynthesis protein Alg14 like-domain-containing protein [Xylariales sp. PMI_506]